MIKKIIIASLCSILFFNLQSCNALKDSKKQWKEIIGFIEGNPRNSYIHYIVSGKEYKYSCATMYGSINEGEKCFLRYNINNPNEVEIMYWKPIFLSDEYTTKANGQIDKIYWFHWNSPKYAIRYTYIIDGVSVTREQVLPPNYKEQYPLLKEGQWYEVECWVENAQRAIIHLDKPL
jgi:hypothetical protein